MLPLRLLLSCIVCAVLFAGPIMASPEVTKLAREFVQDHEKRIKSLDVAGNEAWWQASTTGKPEAFTKKIDAQNKLDAALSNPKVFARLKAIKGQHADIDDKVLARAIDVLYLLYLEKQVDADLLKKMVEKANAVEEKFNKFRAKIDGKELTDNQMREILKNSNDSGRLQAAWEAGKAVGKEVEAELTELVKLRNQAAVQLGYKNFHELQLYLNEQDGKKLLTLFDELDELTRKPFLAAKADIDARLAKRYGIKTRELMPWHYHDPFFQDTPKVFGADIDEPFRKADILKMCRDFYAGIGLPIDRVIVRSDLYEKKGKSQHAFCTDIDREGDVRVLANITANH